MGEKTPAEVRISSLQYRAVYGKPIVGQWVKNYELAQALFEALREWNVSLENISSNLFPANFGQIELNVQQFLQGRYTFRVGPDASSLSVWNPDWTELSTIKKVADASIKAVRETLQIDLQSQDVALDMHLVSRLLKICSNAQGPPSTFPFRSAAFRGFKALTCAQDTCET